LLVSVEAYRKEEAIVMNLDRTKSGASAAKPTSYKGFYTLYITLLLLFNKT